MGSSRKRKSIITLKEHVHAVCGESTQVDWPGEAEPAEPARWYGAMSRRLLLFGTRELVDPGDVISRRREVLFHASMKGVSAEARYERTLSRMSEGFEALSGLDQAWDLVLADRVPDRTPEWMSRAREQGEALLEEHGERATARALLGAWMGEHSPAFDWLVRVCVWFTRSHARVHARCWDVPWGDEAAITETKAAVVARWGARAPTVRMVSVPHGVLSTLPKEMRNVSAALHEDMATSIGAAFKLKPGSKAEPAILSADSKLVLTSGGARSHQSVIEVPVTGDLTGQVGTLEPMALLTSQILEIVRGGITKGRQLENMTRDIPRVVAGMFLAAAEDRDRVQVSGQFLDSDTGLRLAKITGLNYRQGRDLARVQRVRELLTRIKFIRSIERFDPLTRKKERIDWNTPLIQRMADEVVATYSKPDDLEFAKSELGVWLIAPRLWDMTQPHSDHARFMFLDERAFGLNPNSGAFNLYWTIVQRAYNALRTNVPSDKFSAQGEFSPKLETLYYWSGSQQLSHQKNPKLILSSMRTYLEEMVEEGIISDWSSQMIERGRFNQDEFSNERVRISMPGTLLRVFHKDAFVDGINPYATTEQTSLFEIDPSKALA